jgi:hypothetical protein
LAVTAVVLYGIDCQNLIYCVGGIRSCYFSTYGARGIFSCYVKSLLYVWSWCISSYCCLCYFLCMVLGGIFSFFVHGSLLLYIGCWWYKQLL